MVVVCLVGVGYGNGANGSDVDQQQTHKNISLFKCAVKPGNVLHTIQRMKM